MYTLITEAALFFCVFLICRIIKTDNNKTDPNLLSENQFLNRNVGSDLKEYAINGIQSGSNLQEVEPSGKGLIVVVVIGAVIIGVVLFTVYFLLLTKKFGIYLEEIADGITEISAGNFDAKLNIKQEDEFSLIALRINKMSDDIKQLIEDNRKNEYTKNELITSVAHDLRTPLTSIIGYLDLVSKNDNLTEDGRKRYIEIAYNKSKRLEKLIEDLFAYTKFNYGQVVMEQSEIDMIKFINQLVDEFYPSFQESELDYDFTANTTSAFVVADGNLLARAFANLISNAIKYGKDGKSVKLKLTKETDKIIVSVINYGKVIPEKDLENVFHRFYRVEGSRSSETGGTGLGLAIAKSIIELHGGTVAVRSNFEGTVFDVVLDANKEGNGV